MTEHVYLNGGVVPARQATVSAWDAGLLHGASTFTTMLAHHGVIFRLESHLSRLLDTVGLLHLRVDATRESLTAGAYALLEANALREARMRITLTPGSVRGGRPTTLITAESLPEYPQEWYDRGVTVVEAPFKQAAGDVTAGCKTGCYLPRMLAFQEAAAKGAVEALWYTTDNRLAEACFCNVFLVRGGEVFTPPRDTPVLPGVVRQAVIELCGQLELRCRDDESLNAGLVPQAEEIFLTGSCTGIRPVVRVERHVVGGEKPGAVTRHIMQAYRELLDSECSPGYIRSQKGSGS